MKKKIFIGNQKGIAMLEAIPIIWVMFVLLGATLGSWGVVHTAILNSIAARNYTIFLFNNRSDLSYLRDFSDNEYDGLDSSDAFEGRYYAGYGKRFSYIDSENNPGAVDSTPRATLRRVDFRKLQYDSGDIGFIPDSDHNRLHNIVPEIGKKHQYKVRSAWIMVGYGICLNARCGQ